MNPPHGLRELPNPLGETILAGRAPSGLRVLIHGAASESTPAAAAAVVATAKVTWKDAVRMTRSTPRRSWSAITVHRGRKEPRCSITKAPRNPPAMINWPARLDQALPTNPSAGAGPRPGTSTTHPTVETPIPAATRTRGVLNRCTPRIHPCPADATRMHGIPHTATLSQSAAPAATPASAARTRVRGPSDACTPATTTTPTDSAIQVACTPSATASARRPAPCSRAARAVVPYARKFIWVPSTNRTSAPTPSAARSSGPCRPTTIPSTSR